MLKKSILIFILLCVQKSYALTNSMPALGDDLQSVVLLKIDGIDGEGDHVPGYCVGTLLSPTLIITAAHCVADALIIGSSDLQVSLGRYKYVNRPNGSSVRIGYVPFAQIDTQAQFLVMPELQNRLRERGLHTSISPELDIAVLVLKEGSLNLPPDFVYASLVPRSFLQTALSSLKSLIFKVVNINVVEEVGTDTKREAGLNHLEWSSSGWFESQSASRVQEGDSGSPLFVQIGRDRQLIGVVKGRAQSIFSNWDVFSLAPGSVCAIGQFAHLAAANLQLLCK